MRSAGAGSAASSAAKVDLRRVEPGYRAKQGVVEQIDLPPRRYLAIDGHGDPNSPVFAAALAALYPVAYRLKFDSGDATGRDYVVPPLEGLWRADDTAVFTSERDKSRWDWTAMLLVPSWVDDALVPTSIERVRAKSAPDRLDDVRIEMLDEGTVVQTLHVGSFDDEAPVLAHLHDVWIPEHGLRMTGAHHEIYLSDLRRVPPERRRTILRQPVAPV